MFTDKKEFYAQFQSPDASRRGKPFWSWNGELEEEELLRQVDIMKEMGFGGHFMHSRSGLITEYLGDEWFKLINAVADKSEKEGMEAWLYDEDRWPSGSAGGKATKEEEYRMRSVRLAEFPPEKYESSDTTIALFVGAVEKDGINLAFYAPADENDLTKLTEKYAPEYGEKLKILRFDITTDPDSSNFNGSGYLNTMDRRSTEHFIDLTHEQYKEKCGKRIGTSIKGIFTDEPHRGHGLDDLETENGVRTCSIAWTDDFFEEFSARYGYDAKEKLPEVFYRYKTNSVAKIKIDWFDLACDLFNERFAQPINDWCNDNGIKLTGHVLHEDDLCNQTICNGSLMRFYENMGLPGVDTLGCDNYGYWIVKQLSSAARQTGKEQLISELYGCTGWDFDFTGHKNIGDWQAFFGINVRCPHLSWYTMEGEAKRDYPASILHQAPWYKDYNDIETYFARFGTVLSGNAICDTLVINPVESVWGLAYPGWTHWLFSNDEDVDLLSEHYRKLFCFLEGAHIDFDYGEEAMMARLAAVELTDSGAVLRVGKASYSTVIVSGMLTMRQTTLELLKKFREAGGKVIFTGEPPHYLGGEKSDAVVKFASRCMEVPFSRGSLAQAIKDDRSPAVFSYDCEDEQVFIRRFATAPGLYTVALLDTGFEKKAKDLTVDTGISGEYFVEEWDMMTGGKYAVPSEKDSRGNIVFRTRFVSGDAKIFILTDEKSAEKEREKPLETAIISDISSAVCEYSLAEENVCVLDRVDYRIDGGEWRREVEILRADREIREHYGIEHRGGEMLQPWYSKLNDKKVFGKTEMRYIFFVDTVPEGDVTLAAERPEIMHYAINGTELVSDGTFWTDICFKRMKIPAGSIVKGRNEITVTVDFRSTVNFEAIYLLGSFGAEKDGRFAKLTALPEKLKIGDASSQGLAFYGGDMTYIIPAAAFDPLRPEMTEKSKIILMPEDVRGSLMRYEYGNVKGKCRFKPYEADVTDAVKAGGDIRLTLVGNRRCTFGPLHLLPADHKGSSPGHFVPDGDNRSEDIALPPTGIRKLKAELRE